MVIRHCTFVMRTACSPVIWPKHSTPPGTPLDLSELAKKPKNCQPDLHLHIWQTPLNFCLSLKQGSLLASGKAYLRLCT